MYSLVSFLNELYSNVSRAHSNREKFANIPSIGYAKTSNFGVVFPLQLTVYQINEQLVAVARESILRLPLLERIFSPFK